LEQTKAGSKPEEIAALKEVVKTAREALAQRRRDLDRSQSLDSLDAIAAADLEQHRLAAALAGSALAEAEARLAANSYVRDVDLQLREAELASAKDLADVARKAADRTQIRSPIRGRVLRVHSHAGERIGDRGVLELGDVIRMHAVAEVYEADVPRVSLGMRATASVKSTGIVLRGAVVKIEPLVGRKVALDNDPVTDTDARVVEVRVELDAEDSIRVAALTNARVEIVIGCQ
jgi:HlyD family secretion protein